MIRSHGQQGMHHGTQQQSTMTDGQLLTMSLPACEVWWFSPRQDSLHFTVHDDSFTCGNVTWKCGTCWISCNWHHDWSMSVMYLLCPICWASMPNSERKSGLKWHALKFIASDMILYYYLKLLDRYSGHFHFLCWMWSRPATVIQNETQFLSCCIISL